MGLELTGKYVSSTYLQLVQHASDGNYYDGAGNLLNIEDASSLDIILAEYISDASLNQSKFKWVSGLLEPSVAGVATDLTNYINDSSLNQSTFKWASGLLEPSIVGGDVTKSYVDASLLKRDSSISTIISRHNFTETSLYTLTSRHNKTESSLNIVQGLYIPDASLDHTKFIWNAGILDVSVIGGGSDVNKAYVDASLLIRDACIDELYVNKSDITHIHDTRYVKESSLGVEFAWGGGVLHVDVSVVAGGASLIYVDGSLAYRDSSINWLTSHRLDSSLDYTTYEPIISNASFYYTSGLVTQIITKNNLGSKTVDFTYNSNNDVSVININNYGLWSREITFEKDIDENVIAVHIT